MAVVTKDQTTKPLSSRIRVPDVTCALQCVNEEFVESKGSGNMMIHRTYEVLQHPEIKVDGQGIDLAGQELEQYLVTKFSDGKGGFLADTDSKAKKGLGRLFEDYEKHGLADKVEAGIDTNNPPLLVKGLVVDACVGSEEKEVRERPTEEQVAAGVKQGGIVKDESGKPKMMFQLRIKYIMGKSKVSPNPY